MKKANSMNTQSLFFRIAEISLFLAILFCATSCKSDNDEFIDGPQSEEPTPKWEKNIEMYSHGKNKYVTFFPEKDWSLTIKYDNCKELKFYTPKYIGANPDYDGSQYWNWDNVWDDNNPDCIWTDRCRSTPYYRFEIVGNSVHVLLKGATKHPKPEHLYIGVEIDGKNRNEFHFYPEAEKDFVIGQTGYEKI